MGIGTLNEHSLHAFLKDYCDADKRNHEIKIGRYVADIANAGGVTEIQTRGFSHLRRKLEFLLEDHEVTVVYPVAHIKRIIWVDKETGAVSKPRVSPKKGAPFEIFYELVFIKELLERKNLRLRIILVDLDEYRCLDGWSRGGKKGCTRLDMIPAGISSETKLKGKTDFLTLLPEGLPNPFTVPQLLKLAKSSPELAYRAISVLTSMGLIEKRGKCGRRCLYGIRALTERSRE